MQLHPALTFVPIASIKIRPAAGFPCRRAFPFYALIPLAVAAVIVEPLLPVAFVAPLTARAAVLPLLAVGSVILPCSVAFAFRPLRRAVVPEPVARAV